MLNLNRKAYAGLTCPKAFEIVPGATHLFEEPGTLEQVSALAVQWFRRWLAPVAERRAQSGKQAS